MRASVCKGLCHSFMLYGSASTGTCLVMIGGACQMLCCCFFICCVCPFIVPFLCFSNNLLASRMKCNAQFCFCGQSHYFQVMNGCTAETMVALLQLLLDAGWFLDCSLHQYVLLFYGCVCTYSNTHSDALVNGLGSSASGCHVHHLNVELPKCDATMRVAFRHVLAQTHAHALTHS